jgi:hypothetical protein
MAECRRKMLGVMVVLFIILVFGGSGQVVLASELDYLGLELGATWIYGVSELEKGDGLTVEETGRMQRQVIAVTEDPQAGLTTFTIRETWPGKDRDQKEYKLVRTSSGSYFVEEQDELYLVLEAPLAKGSKSSFSMGLWQKWDVRIWGQVDRDTPLGSRATWVAKAWDEYEDGSYAELTMEVIPYVGFLQEAKLERLLPDGCS